RARGFESVQSGADPRRSRSGAVRVEYRQRVSRRAPAASAAHAGRSGVSRARLMLLRFDRDWYSLLPEVTGNDKKAAQRARNIIRDGLSVISPVFKDQQFVLGEECSLVDCALAPLLWRLDYYDIELPRQAKPILD